MCLTSISSRKEVPNAQGVGWKVFRLVDNKLHSEYHFAGTDPWEIGKWYEAYDYSKGSKDYWVLQYPRGFHVFTTRREARLWLSSSYRSDAVMRRVEWRHKLVVGGQSCFGVKLPVIVSKELKITRLKKVLKA